VPREKIRGNYLDLGPTKRGRKKGPQHPLKGKELQGRTHARRRQKDDIKGQITEGKRRGGAGNERWRTRDYI